MCVVSLQCLSVCVSLYDGFPFAQVWLVSEGVEALLTCATLRSPLRVLHAGTIMLETRSDTHVRFTQAGFQHMLNTLISEGAEISVNPSGIHPACTCASHAPYFTHSRIIRELYKYEL